MENAKIVVRSAPEDMASAVVGVQLVGTAIKEVLLGTVYGPHVYVPYYRYKRY
jgi:hypothetical protein